MSEYLIRTVGTHQLAVFQRDRLADVPVPSEDPQPDTDREHLITTITQQIGRVTGQPCEWLQTAEAGRRPSVSKPQGFARSRPELVAVSERVVSFAGPFRFGA